MSQTYGDSLAKTIACFSFTTALFLKHLAKISFWQSKNDSFSLGFFEQNIFLEFLDDFSNVFMYKNEGGILDFLQNWKILDLGVEKN